MMIMMIVNNKYIFVYYLLHIKFVEKKNMIKK